MMGKSHSLIGLAATAVLAAAGFLSLTPGVALAAAFGSLAPDIDTPFSTLGRKLPFISAPLYATIGHRTATHSLFLLPFLSAALLEYGSASGYDSVCLAFLVGYLAHIAGDLLTVEGCVALYPISRTRLSVWPRVRTGSLGEFITVVAIVVGLGWMAYTLNPGLFDLIAQIRRSMTS